MSPKTNALVLASMLELLGQLFLWTRALVCRCLGGLAVVPRSHCALASLQGRSRLFVRSRLPVQAPGSWLWSDRCRHGPGPGVVRGSRAVRARGPWSRQPPPLGSGSRCFLWVQLAPPLQVVRRCLRFRPVRVAGLPLAPVSGPRGGFGCLRRVCFNSIVLLPAVFCHELQSISHLATASQVVTDTEVLRVVDGPVTTPM